MKNIRQRRWPIVPAALVCLLLVGGGTFYVTGGYDSWRDNDALADSCGGVVAKDRIRSALHSEHIEARKGGASLAGEDALADCSVTSRGGGGSLAVSVNWGSKTERAASSVSHLFLTDSGSAAVPVGQGWPGVMVVNDGDLFGAVELECSDRPGESLVVSTRTKVGFSGADGGERERVDFAGVVTSTAAAASEKFGCSASNGQPVSRISPDPVHHPVPLAEAKGTCAPLAALAPEAQRHGASSAVEAPADPHAPVEDCLVTDSQGHTLYRFSALYGSFAKEVRHRTQAFPVTGDSGFEAAAHHGFGSAQCPGGSEKSLYTIAATRQSAHDGLTVKDPDTDFERAALKAFAKQSAKTHGCNGLRLP